MQEGDGCVFFISIRLKKQYIMYHRFSDNMLNGATVNRWGHFIIMVGLDLENLYSTTWECNQWDKYLEQTKNNDTEFLPNTSNSYIFAQQCQTYNF